MADHSATFKAKTVQSVLQLHFKDEKTKVNPDALNLMTELLRVFTSEAAERAAVQANVRELGGRTRDIIPMYKGTMDNRKEGSKLVSTEHVEKILPQLLLDV